MKYIIYIVACLFAIPALAQDKIVPSIAVTGYAEAKLAPDQARLSVEVYTEQRNLKTAKKDQDEKVKNLLAIAVKQGVKQDDIRTLYANVQPLYDYVPNTSKPKFRAYMLSNQVEIVCNDLTITGPLMDALVEAGFDRVQGIQFTLKNRREEEQKLTRAALVNAKTKAADMASALDVKIGKPITITESGSYNPPPIVMAKAMHAEMAVAADASGGSMPSYSPAGLIEISQTVNVTFAIE